MSIKPPPAHPNIFEHTESLPVFLGYFLLYGFLGAFIGRSIDYAVKKIQNGKESKQTSFWSAILQILMNGTIFYLAFKLLLFKRGPNELTFDDWVSSTFQGLIFVTTIYSVQEELTKNIKHFMF
jgi:hypothetical protein